MARQISTSCLPAGLSLSTRQSACSGKPCCSMSRAACSCMRRRFTHPSGNRCSRPRKRFSATERCGASCDSWCTMAIPTEAASMGRRKFTARPSNSISPASRSIMPATIFIRVDLPAPFSPSSRCTSPACTARLPARSATTPPNRFWIPFSSRSTVNEPVYTGNRDSQQFHHFGRRSPLQTATKKW